MADRRLAALTLAVWLLAACAERHRTPLPGDGRRPLGWVDVRVASGPRLRVSADGPVDLADQAGRPLRNDLDLPAGSTLGRLGDRLTLDGRPLADLPCELRPRGDTLLRCEGTRYRGLLRLDADGPGLMALNRLSVDEYLLGVLPSEMPDRFGIEALKAQAVAARSYALSEQRRRPWLHPDQRSQVYGGRDDETAMAREAVRATAEQVLTHDGLVISAFFHSTCGGATAPAAHVYDFPPEGVLERSVTCPDCRHSPTFRWERRLPAAEVCRALGLPGERLDALVASPARYPGRPDTVTVWAGGEQVRLGSPAFRSALSSGRPLEEQLLSTRWAVAPRIEGDTLVISGQGWGHGVGLCQYGAGGYASRGASYRAILDRYYPGADLVRLR